MKITILHATLAFCLSGAPTTLAQQPVNIIPPTPEQQAATEKAVHLTHDAAASLHAGRYAQAEKEARQALSLNDFGVSDEILAAALDRGARIGKRSSNTKPW